MEMRLNKKLLFHLAQLGLISFFLNVFVLAPAMYMLIVYDRVMSTQSMDLLLTVTALLVVSLISFGALEFVRRRAIVNLLNEVEAKSSKTAFSETLQHHQSENRRSETALADLRSFALGHCPQALFDLPFSLFFLLILVLIEPLFGVLALVGLVLLCAISTIAFVLSRENEKTATEARQRLSEFERSAISASNVIISARTEPNALVTYAHKLRKYFRATDLASNRADALTTVTKVVRMALQSSVIFVGAIVAIENGLTIGKIVAGSIILGRMFAPIDVLISQWRAVVRALASGSEVLRLVRENEKTEKLHNLPEFQGRVNATNIYYAASPQSKPFLRNISIEFRPGTLTLLFGNSGSGKSTLAKILTGYVKPQAGNVKYDGAPLSQWSTEALHYRVGYLGQRPSLLPGSISENISGFDPSVNREDFVLAAAKKAQVHSMVVRLKNGYDFGLSAENWPFSEGQLQRLALARALYRSPLFLVLDEPDANLDAEGKRALINAIAEAKSDGVAILVISHHRELIDIADSAYHLIGGRVEPVDVQRKKALITA